MQGNVSQNQTRLHCKYWNPRLTSVNQGISDHFSLKPKFVATLRHGFELAICRDLERKKSRDADIIPLNTFMHVHMKECFSNS